MRAVQYEGKLYRPPSEADAFILQATIGCSWNHCVYCDMYRDKTFRVRSPDDILRDIAWAETRAGEHVEKVFVADGDALIMETELWLSILSACRKAFPNLRRVSCYAMARNVGQKTDDELRALRAAGLSLLYIGPESGDPETLKRIAKGDGRDEHIVAAERAKAASIALSAIFLLGAGGVARSEEHAHASASLATAMDPAFLAALTLTVVPQTPLAKLVKGKRFELPDKPALLSELETFVAEARPSDALFRTNHASNYLPIGGRLPRDRDAILRVIAEAKQGAIPLRGEAQRGL